ncbi:Diacylglycerol O-acyltransferase 2 [Tetrabaena socialis]|uniref:Acyltransferase n=1 Tax=Tetrabaena socialis TaxID=47790 RepID=A0A2J8A0Q9_9CHLO|nr:Diacylglycerol O-acyltransferase 2 [Tetrabaena socialis]|eukprot:PNH06113.1 Diacylglycerol O-acyltransferase 2 [Tetrabaena socialis]
MAPAKPAKAAADRHAAKVSTHILKPGENPPTGVRVYADGIDPNQKQNPLVTLLAGITLSIYCGFMNYYFLLIIAAFFSRTALYVVIALLSTLAIPARPVLWPAFNRLWIFKTWRHYFHYSFLVEEPLDPEKRYIFVEFPHGAFPIGPIVAGTLMQTLYPQMAIYSVAASVVFYIPFWRHFITWIGSVPATPGNFKKLLKKGSVAVVVGGIAEMYMGHPKRERIKLVGRRGFARIALEEQVDAIVCVYYFGQSQVLSFGPSFLADVSRRLRMSFGLLTGWMGLPVPKPLPIYMVNGRPIPVPKVARDSPDFDAEVDKLLAATIQELREMYDRHRGEYGWADRPLTIE